MGQKHNPNSSQAKIDEIRVVTTSKKKKLLKSGVLRKKSHLSASTRVKQAKKDQQIFGTGALAAHDPNIETHIDIPDTSKMKMPRPPGINLKKMKFVGIPTSKALDTYVRRQCHALLKRVSARPNKYRLKFRIQPVAKNFEGTISHFQVDGVMTITGRKSLRASGQDTNIKRVVDHVIESLEKQVRRETEKRERSRKTLGRSMQLIREFNWEFAFDQKE